MMFEDKIEDAVFSTSKEKSWVDKLLAKEDAEKLRRLSRKRELSKEDLSELLYLLTNVELKLSNLTEYDRYLLGKYFAWFRDLVKLCEMLYDYIKEHEKDLDQSSLKMLKDVLSMYVHNVKFACDVFLFLVRSTLGVEGYAFDTLSKTRYEHVYPQTYLETPQQPKEQKRFFIFKR